MNITVVGAGYVGLSNALLLAQYHSVRLLDINTDKVAMIEKKKSPISDKEIEDFLSDTVLDLVATTQPEIAYQKSDFVIIATPTDYDIHSSYFDTRSVEFVLEQASTYNIQNVTIKSTVPVGFTTRMQARYPNATILFSPEFLREGHALYDNLYPSRIIVGGKQQIAKKFAELMRQVAVKKDVPVLFTGEKEAEAAKLFANTYLAMRISFFNELDTYAEANQLDTREIIDGVCSDPRIGFYYNNPSFGYGGYCLPKDTKQLLANYHRVSNTLIRAIVESNETRKNVIVENIRRRNPKIVGVYRLVMKNGSDNFRASAVLDIMARLSICGIHVIVYEPTLTDHHYQNYPLIAQLDEFIQRADVIIANRMHDDLQVAANKVYTRDVFGSD